MAPPLPRPSPGELAPNQILHLHLGDHALSGVIVSQTEAAIVVASPQRERPAIEPGATVRVEVPRRDGLFTFTTRLLGLQLMPMLVLLLDRPKAFRRIQRRSAPRLAVDWPARLIYVGAEHSINRLGQLTNVSLAGCELALAEAPPAGPHVVLVLESAPEPVTAIARVLRVRAGEDGRHRIGLRFVEMSQADQLALHALIAHASGPEPV